MHLQKMQKNLVLSNGQKSNRSPEKKLSEGQRPTVVYETCIESSGWSLKSISQSHQQQKSKTGM